jgi:molybdopterin synthase sulfur carrier subunit
MRIMVDVPASMRGITMGRSEIEACGSTIRELISDLDRQYPGFQARICDETGKIQKFIAIFVNGSDIRTLHRDQTPLSGNEKVSIIAAIAGG